MADNDMDVLKPWSIKAISGRVSDEISAEAKRSDVTTGRLIEQMWAAWKANGSPVHVPTSSAPDFASLLQAAGPFTEGNPMPREVRSLLNEMARSYRRVKPGHTSVPRLTSGNGLEAAEARTEEPA